MSHIYLYNESVYFLKETGPLDGVKYLRWGLAVKSLQLLARIAWLYNEQMGL